MPRPARFVVTGDTGLFDDARSLLFLHVVFEVLPTIPGSKRATPLWALLTHSLYAHAALFWSSNPAHQHYLFSLVFDELGDHDKAAKALLVAFNSTAAEAHDYFTRAFNYWSYLVEHDRRDAAAAFALKLYRSSPPRWLDHAERLVHQSFEVRTRPREGSAA